MLSLCMCGFYLASFQIPKTCFIGISKWSLQTGNLFRVYPVQQPGDPNRDSAGTKLGWMTPFPTHFRVQTVMLERKAWLTVFTLNPSKGLLSGLVQDSVQASQVFYIH